MNRVRSMTGFATARLGEGRGCQLTIKSVNHRFLDLSFRLPAGSDELEMRLRRLLKERIRRGHVELTVSAERGGPSAYGVNETVLAGYLRAFQAAAERLAIPGPVDLGSMARLPGVITQDGDRTLGAESDARVMDAMESLLRSFERTREEEGTALVTALQESLDALRKLVREARELRVGVQEDQLARLRARMEHLLTSVAEVSEARLLAEAALLAERSDVEEELLRLETHIESFAGVLAAAGELGKRLDFLLQEMNREVNTLLSKTGGAAGHAGTRLTEVGLACKSEIERMREQVQNLE